MKRVLGVWTKVQAKMKRLMKNYMIILPVSAMTLCVSLPKGAQAQVAVLEVIKAGVKKVIKAVDLKVQRLQNETIWLQNAQKVLENQLSKLKLTEIADWTGRQKELYEKYYKELWEVKSAITYFKRIRELTGKQLRLVDEYQWALGLFSKDKHFSVEELEEMKKVYQGILEEGLKNVDEILLVISSFKTQMSDAERLELIAKASQRLDENYTDLQKFNRSQMSISVSRAKSNDEVVTLKELYGLE
ncbi:conjugal transfer protein TraI [Pedobacter jeongneungensis]|uniref:conjugal transfer protein TraI n=1 Tax=Pedobacter jeongneungensis TaxID=947309 RepID=UPI000AF08FB1|nr:conjugal transfer protein TraI [Pedobacter jeongneungensis]